MISTDQMSDREVIARTLWAEARSQGTVGMQAVANVICNRADHPAWWGHDPRSVCLADQQFSCWNPSDQQAKIIRAKAIFDRRFSDAMNLASHIDDLPDITNGADHYCTEAVVGKTKWARGRIPVAHIGTHLFFKIGPSG